MSLSTPTAIQGSRTCDHCGDLYRRPPSQTGRFCSKRCAAEWRWSQPEYRSSQQAKLAAASRRPEVREKISQAMQGRVFSPEHLEKLRAAGLRRFEREQPFGERAPRWRGDDAVSNSIHAWITKHFPKTGVCEECGANVGAKTQAGTHYAFRFHGQPYTRDRDDYRELCPPCHMAFDRVWRESKRAAG